VGAEFGGVEAADFGTAGLIDAGVLDAGGGFKDVGARRQSVEEEVFQQLDTAPSRWDNPTMIVIMDSKRRLTLPAGLIPASAGDSFEVRFDAEEDAVVFRRLPGSEDWLDVLANCPVSMDDVPPRKREFKKMKPL
jgi:hypothetical protein